MKWKRGILRPVSTPRTSFSLALRDVMSSIGKRDYAAALSKLSNQTPHASTLGEKSKIATLVAQTQFLLGRYGEAAEQYRTASELDREAGQETWLRPALGEIRCLLKAQELERAHERAQIVQRTALERHTQFEALANTSTRQLQQLGSLRVGIRPIRPTVVFTRLGAAFLQEGYLEEAKGFFETVIAQTPNGASRARQFLATICLREQNFERAEQLARESLQMGRFQAKTIASWPLLLKARFAQKKDLLDANLYESFQLIQQGSVRARTVLVILKELRSYGDAAWENVAQGWLNRHASEDPVVRVEILKIFLSDQKIASRSPEWILQTCSTLLEDPLLAASESIGIAKSLTEYGFLASEPQTQNAAQRIRQRFGEAAASRATHAMALGAMMANQYDFARRLLSEQAARLAPGSEQWGKDMWALARMEGGLNNHTEEARHYLAIAEQASIPPQFRLQGFLRWFQAAEKSGEKFDEEEIHGRVAEIVSSIADYRALLDAGRQLALAGRRFKEICTTVAQEGEKKALATFRAEKDPIQALNILNHLARRQYYDLSRTGQMLKQWENLGEDKLNWLWTPDARYWEYLSLIMRGYFECDKTAKGETLAKETLADPATPETGVIFLAAHYAEWLIEEKRISEAWPLFERMLRTSPTHRLSAHAHYWIALRAHVKVHNTQARQSLQRARQCLAPKPGLLWEWSLDAKAALLLKKLANTPIDTRLYQEKFLATQKEALARDLKKLG